MKGRLKWAKSLYIVRKVPNFIFTLKRVSFMMKVISISFIRRHHREMNKAMSELAKYT